MINVNTKYISGKVFPKKYFAAASLTLLINMVPLQTAYSQDQSNANTNTEASNADNAEEDTDDSFILNLQNVDISSLIETVSRRTGRNFIVDPRVKATVHVISSEPVNADKLYEIFLSILAVHGYAAVEAGAVTKIVPANIGTQSAVPVYSETTDTGDKLITQVVQLERLSAQQMVMALQPLIPQTASIAAEGNANAIIVTERADNIGKLIELIFMIDGG